MRAARHNPGHAAMRWGRLREWACNLKRDVIALWFAYRDPRTPQAARLLAMMVVAYALSPIDLIPDFIPVLGYLDELVLLPAALYLALKLIPPEVVHAARARAVEWSQANASRPQSRLGAVIVVCLWCVLAWLGWQAAAALPAG